MYPLQFGIVQFISTLCLQTNVYKLHMKKMDPSDRLNTFSLLPGNQTIEKACEAEKRSTSIPCHQPSL